YRIELPSSKKRAVTQVSEQIGHQTVASPVSVKTIEENVSEVARIYLATGPVERAVDLGVRDISDGGRHGDVIVDRFQVNFDDLKVIALVVRPGVNRPVFIDEWIVNIHRADDRVTGAAQ